MLPAASELKPTREAEFIPGEPKKNMLGDTSRPVVGDTNAGVLTVVPKGVKPLNPAARRSGLMPVVVRPRPKGVMPLNVNGFPIGVIGFPIGVNGLTIGVVGNDTLKPPGNNVFKPGGNKVVDPAGFKLEFKAACSSSMNCVVGDKVVVFVNGLVPGTTMKFLPELCIMTVPAGISGFVSGTFIRVPFNGGLTLPLLGVGVGLIGEDILSRGTVMGVARIIAELAIPIRIIGGRAKAGMAARTTVPAPSKKRIDL
jgi:hypothetical protein